MEPLSIEYLLSATGDYEFKDSVKQLAVSLQKINDQAAGTSANTSSLLFQIAYQIDLEAEELIAALTPLANVSDAIEAATEAILQTVAGRPEAYVTPPPGDAATATISASMPVEQ